MVVTTWEAATGTWWLEVKDAARQRSVMHRMAPTTEDCLTPNINSAEAEKPEYVRMNDKYVSLVGDKEPEPYI